MTQDVTVKETVENSILKKTKEDKNVQDSV